MQILAQALLQLCLKWTITDQEALAVCHDPDQLAHDLRGKTGVVMGAPAGC